VGVGAGIAVRQFLWRERILEGFVTVLWESSLLLVVCEINRGLRCVFGSFRRDYGDVFGGLGIWRACVGEWAAFTAKEDVGGEEGDIETC
jgi:hypothetical protein